MLKEDTSDEDKKAKIWNVLLGNTEDMKREFQDCLQNLSNGKEVTPYNATD